jgi:hypothetical protein
LTHDQYEILERALSRGSRVAIRRRNGREYIVIPITLRTSGQRESIEARNPTTGHELKIFLDEIEAINAMP